MRLGIQQVQKMSQRLVMTPQMQQSVKLLQMNTMELEAMAQQEMLENPFLEVDDGDSPNDGLGSEETLADSESVAVKEKNNSEDGDDRAPDDGYDTQSEKSAASEANSDEIASDVESNDVAEQPEQFSEVDANWEEVFEDTTNYQTYRPPRNEDNERDFDEFVAGGESLYEKLEWQLRVSTLEGLERRIGEYLIGCIDERGFLECDLEDCAHRFDVSVERVEAVLHIIQEFEPAGVGARDLPECLTLQLSAHGDLTPLARELLSKHWDLVLKRKMKELMRVTGADEKDLADFFEKLRHLDPAPGGNFTKQNPQYIKPDVYVRKMDGKYEVFLQEGQVAHLRLSNVYKNLLIEGPKPGQDPKEREYALEKYRAAVMFIKNIERRRNTVQRVTEAIMEYQRDFLEKGIEALRPLSLSEIAEKVDLHESTVSRVTSGKYVDTPQGLFELKFFFSSAIQSKSGAAASSRSVKEKVREMIENEDSSRPLSDEKIARILKEQGYTIARRTVAKYREQMRIPATNLRRKTG